MREKQPETEIVQVMTPKNAMKPVVSLNSAIAGDIFFWARGAWDQELIKTLQKARAVILPQTVQRELYALCKAHCARVFPNYDLRFQWEGKMGDTLLFWTYGIPHPAGKIFPRVETLTGAHPVMDHRPELPEYPFVLKATKGGEGRHTWLVQTVEDLHTALRILEQLEWQGSPGFVTQEYLPGLDRDLRVVVIGDRIESYWRCSPGNFYHNLAGNARIDMDSDQELQATGREAVRRLCGRTGINLAGFDLVFPEGADQPLFLEINYTFGRTGLGGSDVFYDMLQTAVNQWLARKND